MTTMEALILTAPGAFHVGRVPVPEPGPMEVLCRVAAVAICGTDPHIIAGEYPGFWPREYPFVPGHEWAGEIVALGPWTAPFGWHVGQRVAGTSHAGCGYCRMCGTGRYNLCEAYGDPARGHRQYGHYSPGAYAEYVVHGVRSVFPVPPELPLEEAALMDPASIALYCAKRAAFGPGETVVVLGLGPIGLLVVMCAFALGAGRVIAVGRGQRLERAVALGAEPVDYTAGDAVGAVRALTGGRGAPAVVECAGVPETLAQAVHMAARGGCVAAVGIPTGPEGDAAPLPLRRAVLDEIEIRGVRANRNTCAEVLPLMASRRVDAGQLITHRFPLREYATALETFTSRKGGALKVIVTP
ncbi:MAG TPA: alcohol dehydrogenase catalytic domain-containing protein [Chloroflexota bacterium]|nr:alcohol dehydrogenase catalytic domain-containing protein [Chloroflexota bacterium]